MLQNCFRDMVSGAASSKFFQRSSHENGPSAIAGAVSPPYSTGCLDTLHNTISIATSSSNLTPCPVTPPFSRMPRDTRPMPSLISRRRRKRGQTASFFLEGGYATQIKPFQCIFGLSVSVFPRGFVITDRLVVRFRFLP